MQFAPDNLRQIALWLTNGLENHSNLSDPREIALLPKTTQSTPVLTPTLIKAARALLDFSQEELAANVDVSRKTLSYVEMTPSEKIDPRRRETLEKIRARLEKDFHVQFVFEEGGRGEGVFLKRPFHKPDR